MKFKLNCSPHLRMHEITKKLFNSKFLSDIQFSVGGKVIYAHSLELMKRSVIFEKQLEDTWGEKKLIPITDCSYGSFLEFIKFIYTDECNINVDNGIELLKLATKYQIIMLESRVINLLRTNEWFIQLFEHCVVEKYEIVKQRVDIIFAITFASCLTNPTFLSLHPYAVNEVLKFDEVSPGVTEFQIFIALAEWIDNYCNQNQMSLSQGRQQFDGLIKKIRFPTMSNDEIRECVRTYPGLVTKNDCMSIGKQVFYRVCNSNDLWISKCRNEYKDPFEYRKFNRDTVFETKFCVSKYTILYGLWIGTENETIEIEISEKNIQTNKSEKLTYTQPVSDLWPYTLISLGESILLKPSFEYTIVIKYLEITSQYEIICRKKNVDLFFNNPENTIQITASSDIMLEMMFKLPLNV